MDEPTRVFCSTYESTPGPVATIHPSICAGLLAAQAAVQPVEKDKKNSHHGYSYASAEAIIREGRAALVKGGLSLLTTGWTLNTQQTKYYDDVSKGELFTERLFVVVTYVLCSREASFTFSNSTPVLPEKGRPVDKATAAALSYDLAYTLRGLLLLPRVDEATEVDARDDTPRQRPTPAQTQAPTQTRPADMVAECRKLANELYVIAKSKAPIVELLSSVCSCKSISEAAPDKLPALRDALQSAIKGASSHG